MIWPEFEDIHGEIILDKDKTVPQNGTARMWIVISKMRQYHIGKLQVGTKGYFMEGERKVAECEVIELIGLNFNPVD